MTRKALVIVIFGNEYQIKKSNLIEKISDRIDKINEDEDTSFTKKKIEEDILDNKSRKTFTQNVLKTIKGEISSSEKRVSRILTVIEQQDISNDNKNEIEKINNEWKENMQRVLENMQDKALDIEEILQKCEIKPQVIQVEAHPYFTQDELRKILDEEDIKLMSWYPLGHGDSSLMNEKIFKQLGEKYHKTPAQIILRWHTQMRFIVIPGTKNVEHVKENFDIFDFKLTPEDMEEIAKINKNERYYTRTEEMLKHFATWQPEYEK